MLGENPGPARISQFRFWGSPQNLGTIKCRSMRDRDRQRERQRDRDRDGETETETERQRQRDSCGDRDRETERAGRAGSRNWSTLQPWACLHSPFPASSRGPQEVYKTPGKCPSI